MADREKVICAIKNCIAVPKCRDCPWEECEEQHVAVDGIPLGLMREALELLEEQEPVKWIDCGDSYKCSRCGVYVDKSVRFKMDSTIEYCPHCGKKVQWDG